MRTFKIANKDIRALLTERNKWVMKGRKLDGEMRELKEKFDAMSVELNKCALQLDKVRDKLIPLVKREVEPLAGLEEFEEINSVEINKGELVVEVIDRVEEFKGREREKKVQASVTE